MICNLIGYVSGLKSKKGNDYAMLWLQGEKVESNDEVKGAGYRIETVVTSPDRVPSDLQPGRVSVDVNFRGFLVDIHNVR